MDVLKSLSAFFSSVPTPTKRRQEPSPPATIEEQNGHAIEHLTDAHRTPAIWLVALQTPPNEWRAGSPVRHMSLHECVHPVVSSWIIANWDACVWSFGKTRAAEVAQAILHAREPDAQMERSRG